MEFKFHDLNIDDAVVAQNGTIVQASCVLIAAGTGQSERVGRRINVVKLQWRYEVTLPETTDATKTHDDVRFVLYVDKQANGATAAVTDILVSDNYQSYYQLRNIGRFAVLVDKTINLQSTSGVATTGYGEASKSGDFEFLLDMDVDYTGTTGVLTEIASANIGVMLVGSGGLAGFTSKMRIRYSD